MAYPEGKLVPVPLVADLAKQGHARADQVRRGSTTYTMWTVDEEGQRLIYAAMAHNRAVLRADPVYARQLELESVRNARRAS